MTFSLKKKEDMMMFMVGKGNNLKILSLNSNGWLNMNLATNY